MVFKNVVVGGDEAGLAQDGIECEVFDTLLGVTSRKNRKRPIPHDGYTPEVRNGRSVGRMRRRYFRIDCGDEPIEFQRAAHLWGEGSLGKNHHTVELKRGSSVKAFHPVYGRSDLLV